MTPEEKIAILEANIKRKDNDIAVLIEQIRPRPVPSPQQEECIGSIRTNVFMDEEKEWLIERVNAGMGEWDYVISYLGEYFATAPSETIARQIVEMQCHTCPVFTPQHDAEIRNATLDELQTIIKNSHTFAEKQCIERVAQDARDYYNIRASTLEFVLDKIESLRKGEQP